MQAGAVGLGSPVASVQRFVVEQVERHGHVPAALSRNDHQQVFRHRLAQLQEELQREVGHGAVSAVGAHVAVGEEHPVLLRDLAAAQVAELHAGIAHLASLLADFLALVVAHLAEVIVEAAIAGVEPVELHAVADQHAGILEHVALGLVGEQAVKGGKPAVACIVDGRNQQQPAALVVFRQQARSAHRRERDRGQQLGIVGNAVALVRIGPGPIEYVFPVGVLLHVHRHRRDQVRAQPQGQVLRHPAGAQADALRLLQCQQEGMAQERVLARESVPVLRGHFVHAVEHAEGRAQGLPGILAGGVAHFSSAVYACVSILRPRCAGRRDVAGCGRASSNAITLFCCISSAFFRTRMPTASRVC